MRILATACFSFAAAIFAAQTVLPFEGQPYLAFAAAALGALAVRLLRGNVRLRASLIAFGCAAALLYNFAYVSIVQRPCAALNGTEETVTVELCAYPRTDGNVTKANVRILDRGLHGEAVYYGSGVSGLEPGDRLRARVVFRDASRFYHTDVTTFTSRGVYLLLYERGDAAAAEGRRGSLLYFPQRLAHGIGAAADRLLPAREAGFVHAILLGDKSKLTAADAAGLSEAGIYHITAVSGLHCSFLLVIVSVLLGRRRRATAFAAIPLFFLYALTVGASPSVIRACIMLSMALIGPLIYRENDPVTSLSLALLFLLLANPFAAASVSLQLSFGAVGGILLIVPKLWEKIGERVASRPLRAVLLSFAVTLGASAFTAPLSAWYFNRISLVSVFGNLLCLWAVSLIFAFSFFTVALSAIWFPAAQLAADILCFGIRYVLEVAAFLSKLPFHAIYFTNASFRLWLGAVAVMALVCCLFRGRYRWQAMAGFSALTLALTVWLNTLPTRVSPLTADVLDVGQGQSVLLLSGERSALIDCGSANSYVSAGDVAADHLLSAGYGRLDHLILTHLHEDHINGLETLLARVPVDDLLLPPAGEKNDAHREIRALAERYGVSVREIRTTRTLPLDGAAVTVFPPVGSGGEDETGLSVLCASGTFELLVTGDMSEKTEKKLAEFVSLPDVEAIVAGHHGSKYSTGDGLLTAVKPEIAAVSVGGNSHGHPAGETLLRLREHGVSVYRTDRQGSIRITVG